MLINFENNKPNLIKPLLHLNGKQMINEIAEEIFRSGRFKALCKSITKNDTLAEELHSEFICKILQNPDLVTNAKDIDAYCCCIIWQLWNESKRITYKGKTSPLFNYTDTQPEGVEFKDIDMGYDETIDVKYNYVKEIVKEDFYSPNIEKTYKARVYYYSQSDAFVYDPNGNQIPVCGSQVEFARQSKINHENIRWAIFTYRKYLKKFLKCLHTLFPLLLFGLLR